MTPDELGERLHGHPSLRDVSLLVLHGSRARGDAGQEADWDLGVLTATGSSPNLPAIVAAMALALSADRVDVVDLSSASALLRFRTARDGVAVIERETGAFVRFRQEAVRFWCDAGPVIRAAQDDVLARLG